MILIKLSVVLRTESGALFVFHCVNPEVIAWQGLVPAIVEEISTPEIAGDCRPRAVNHSADGLDLNEVKIDDLFVQGSTVWLLDFYQQLRVDGADKGNYG